MVPTLWLSIKDHILLQDWSDFLRAGGWKTALLSDGELSTLPARTPGLVVADLPGLGGSPEAIGRLKAALGPRSILLTSRALLPDSLIARALESGADDYLAAPLDHRIRTAKIRAHVRRLAPPDISRADVITSPRGDLRMDLKLRTVETSSGATWSRLAVLTPIECRILRLLLSYAGNSLERAFIIETVWQERSAHIFPATVDKHVGTLRRKLGPWSSHVRTIYGGGYGYVEEDAI